MSVGAAHLVFVLIIVVLCDEETPETETCITRNTVQVRCCNSAPLSCAVCRVFGKSFRFAITVGTLLTLYLGGMNLDLPITKQERRPLLSYSCCARESSSGDEGDVLGAAERKASCPVAASMKVTCAELDKPSTELLFLC